MKPRIAAVVACCKFPYAGQVLRSLSKLVDDIYIRFDVKNGDPELQMNLPRYCCGKLRHLDQAQNGWIFPDWREECLDIVKNAEVKPDIVLVPDEDEMFDEGMKEELSHFWKSDKKGMMFDYHPLESSDGRPINKGMPYPPDPHMKAFKYSDDISYFPYHGDAKIGKYHSPKTWFRAKTKIRHFTAFTPQMQEAKKWRSDTPIGKGTKSVTIIGFGNSARRGMEIAGQPWTCNNYWDLFDSGLTNRVTRCFEMHKFGHRAGGHWDKVRDFLKDEKATEVALQDGELRKREDLACRDGKPYLWHLDQAGKRGTRIMMLEEHPAVEGSEALPVDQYVAQLGVDWFAGTPCYMMACAIAEGFNHIRVYGLDQSDWEHTIQRDCFAGWCMYAIAKGIRMDGHITWLKAFTKRYGRDYGPEWGPYQQDLMDRGHMVSTRYRVQSRAMIGDVCPDIGG